MIVQMVITMYLITQIAQYFVCESYLYCNKTHHYYNFTADTCPWLTPTNLDWILECKDGTQCNTETATWSCCNDHGGRAKCPLNIPEMCDDPLGCAGGTDYCCSFDCELTPTGRDRLCNSSMFHYLKNN